MKKIYLSFFLSASSLLASAQTCRITKDSISAGDGVNQNYKYTYDGSDKLIKVEKFTNNTPDNIFDTLYYTGSQLDSVVEKYMLTGKWYRQNKTTVIYTAGKITRLVAEGNLSNIPNYNKKAHDVTYDANGRISAITFDNAAKVGSPDGFKGTFKDIVRDGSGNLTGCNIVDGATTYPFSVTSYDTKNNLDLLQPHEIEPGWLLLSSEKHNVTLAVITGVGNALEHVYTYDAFGNVLTYTDKVSIFNSKEKTTTYKYYCPPGVNVSDEKISSFSIYPNPAQEVLKINSSNPMAAVSVYNTMGELVLTTTSPNINVSNLSNGVYFLSVQNAQGNTTKTFMVQH